MIKTRFDVSHDSLHAVLETVVAPGAPVVQTLFNQLINVPVSLLLRQSPMPIRKQALFERA